MRPSVPAYTRRPARCCPVGSPGHVPACHRLSASVSLCLPSLTSKAGDHGGRPANRLDGLPEAGGLTWASAADNRPFALFTAPSRRAAASTTTCPAACTEV